MRHRATIAHRLTALMVVSLALTITIGSSVTVLRQFQLVSRQQEQERDAITRNVAPVLTYLLWVVNPQQTEQLVRTLPHSPRIVGARILDEHHIALVDLMQDTPRTFLKPQIEVWHLTHYRDVEEIPVGVLEVAFLHPWRAVLSVELLSVLFGSLLAALIPVLILAYGFHRQVFEPLTRLRRDVRGIDFTASPPARWHQAQRTDHVRETRAMRLLLSRMAAQFQRAMDEREQAEQHKAILLQEVHHRVKNNLQLITSLIALQRHSIADHAAQEVLQDSENRIVSMALVHELLYHEQRYSALNLGTYLLELARTIVAPRTADGCVIRLTETLADVIVPLDQAIPLGLVTNELLTNAMKHGFPRRDEGSIHLQTRVINDTGTLELQVSDDGCGLPPGWTTEQSGRLGFSVITSLCEQLNASLEILAPRGKSGVCFCIRVPPQKDPSRKPH